MPLTQISHQLKAFLETEARQLKESPRPVYRSKGHADLVTDTDLQLEERCRRFLTELLPGSTVVAEEEGGQSSEWTWWVDPLDGTTNFVHTWPRAAISVALFQGRTARLAVVCDPYQKETFWAENGKGAWRNGELLRVSDRSELQHSLLATGFCPQIPAQWSVAQTLYEQSHGLRVSGCASLDFAYLAAGRLDGFWEVDLKSWDVAAGLLLVREAGGKATDFQGQSATLETQNFVVSNGRIHQALLQRLEPLR